MQKVCLCVFVCMCVCVHVCMWMCVRMWMCEHVHALVWIPSKYWPCPSLSVITFMMWWLFSSLGAKTSNQIVCDLALRPASATRKAICWFKKSEVRVRVARYVEWRYDVFTVIGACWTKVYCTYIKQSNRLFSTNSEILVSPANDHDYANLCFFPSPPRVLRSRVASRSHVTRSTAAFAWKSWLRIGLSRVLSSSKDWFDSN